MTSARILSCDVGGIDAPDVTTVAVLARMQLVARRLGYELRLESCPAALAELLCLAGLSDQFPAGLSLRVEAGRQPEEGEHPLRVQEEADAGDAPA